MLQSVSELSGSLRSLTPGFHAARCIADDLLSARLGLIAHVAMKRRKFERGRFGQSLSKDRMTAHSLDFTFWVRIWLGRSAEQDVCARSSTTRPD
jgi:hypothetical protein